jgi:hypothetical protein
VRALTLNETPTQVRLTPTHQRQRGWSRRHAALNAGTMDLIRSATLFPWWRHRIKKRQGQSRFRISS